MQKITESLNGLKNLASFVNEGLDEPMNEGLKDIINSIKDKFKKVIEYAKGVIANVGSYWVPVDKKGNVLPAISPLTSGQAYLDGNINKNSTCVILDKAGAAQVGLNTSAEDVLKTYGPGNTLDYWKKLDKLTSSTKKNVNEVKLQNSDSQAKHIVVDNDMLVKNIRLALKFKHLNRLLIFGAPGIGKTAIVQEVLKEFPEYGNALITKQLSNETHDNFTLPTYIEVNGETKATDVPKTWLPVYKPTGDKEKDDMLDKACGSGLLFIDELSRATQQVLNVMLPLINEGVFNGYKIGSGWSIICATNRMEDELTGQAVIGTALSTRFRKIYYEPTVKSWKQWAEKQGYMSPLLLQWLSMPKSENNSGGKFFYWDPNEDSSDVDSATQLMCTPRSWDVAMRTLAAFAATAEDEGWADLGGFALLNIPRSIIAHALNQAIPSEAVDSFLSFLDVISRIGDFDAAVRAVWDGENELNINKKDLAMVAIPLMQLLATSHAKSLPTSEEFKNCCKWVASQGSDQLASSFFDVFRNVFFPGFSFSVQNAFFNKKVWEKNKDMAAIKSATNKMLKMWKIDELPDYTEGFMLLAKKYKDSFIKYTVTNAEGKQEAALG